MAAKKGPAYQMSNTHRDKIKNSNILNVLVEHAEGRREMTSTQVTAGIALLKKIMPDMQAQSFVDGEGNDLPASISIDFKSAKS